jgi:hypothetical protein
MKKIASALLLFILVFSAMVPAFAQKGRPVRSIPAADQFVSYERVRSFSDGSGVYLGWDLRSESANMGFNIIRLDAGGPVTVNATLIPGGAIRSSRPVLYGEKYEFFDPQGSMKSRYIVQAQATNGRQNETPAIDPVFTKNFEADTGRPKSYFTETPQANGNLRSEKLTLPAELEEIVRAAELSPNLNAQRYVVSQPGAKIGVRTDGIYRVTRGELQAAGFDVNSNPVNWRLFMEGNEQAINVEPNGQYIEFYGRAIDIRESDTRIYYLISDGIAGKRMLPKQLRPFGTAASPNYRTAVTKKERTQYASRFKNGETENFFGSSVFNTPAAVVPFVLTGVDPAAANAVLTITMQGVVGNQHTVNVSLNGHALGSFTGAFLDSFSGQFSVPASFLVEGENSLSLNTTLSSDANYFDSVTVSYTRRYKADASQASFFTPGYRRANVTGFTGSNITLYETTFDGDTQIVINPDVVSDGGGFTLRLPADRPGVFFAVEPSAVRTSPSVTHNNPSAYSSSAAPMEFAIISFSDPAFLAAAESWAAYRKSGDGGRFSTTKVVDIADVYDEFSYGVHSSAGINEFLHYAKDNLGTEYVLLLGDGSYDPRNYEGWGNFDYIPTKMVDLIFEETGSDDALADFDHDGLADIAIGRIPARNAFSITSALNKVVGFETPVNQSLGRGVVLAYDLPNDYDFEAMSRSIGFQMPEGTPVTYVSRGMPPPNQNTIDPNAQSNLINALNTGPILANYSGHGSAGLWASSGFFGGSNVQQLTNANNPTIYTMLTCYNGYFLRPRAGDESIAEALLQAQGGGAAATWASSTETAPAFQGVMGERFYHTAGIGDIKRLGDLIRDAKTPIAGSDVGYSWVLLGDPALQLRQ